MSKNMKYSEVRQIVYKRYHGKCAICGNEITLEDMCISLIVPKSKGGYKDFSNMQAACETCARMKHDMTQEEFMLKLWKIAIYNLGGIMEIHMKRGEQL
jgi:Restriction endonuclease